MEHGGQFNAADAGVFDVSDEEVNRPVVACGDQKGLKPVLGLDCPEPVSFHTFPAEVTQLAIGAHQQNTLNGGAGWTVIVR